MSVNVRQDGSFEVTYVGPYTGLNTQQPENLIKDTDSPALSDVILRNSEIRSRPARAVGLIPSPSNALGFTIGALGNSLIVAGVFAITSTGVFTWDPHTGTWTSQSAAFLFTPGWATVPNYRVFQNKAFMVNGSPHLASLTGTTFVLDNASVAGPTTVGATFIDELDNHLIMANTNEGGTPFPQRIRWSATGLPTVWDPTVNVNAGLADFIEVTDQISGLMMLGRVGYILRTNGITEVSPTGQGVAPFDFNHLWASQIGIGNGPFFAAAQYGTTGVFVSYDNIYSIQAMQLSAIGGTARDAIMRDIAANINPNFPPLGAVVPVIDFGFPISQASGPGGILPSFFTAMVPYLVYYLVIPGVVIGGNQFTRIWVYSFEDNSWTDFTLPQNAVVTCRPSFVHINTFVAGPGATTPAPVVMFSTAVNGASGTIDTFNSGNFNDPLTGSSYSYRMEDIVPDRQPTVRRVILTYRDLGVANINVTLTGTDDNATVQSITVPVTIGNTVPTNTLMTKFVDIEFTGFRPQLSWSRAANGGPVSIARATMVGQVETEVTL